MHRIALLALLLAGAAGTAGAADFFVGVDAAPIVVWQDCRDWVVCSSRGYDGHSSGYALRAGVWLPHEGAGKYGFEIGYDRPGSISGARDYLIAPGCVSFCTPGVAHWKSDAAIMYIDVIGFGPPENLDMPNVDPAGGDPGGADARKADARKADAGHADPHDAMQPESGGLIGKVGLYNSVITTDVDLGAAGAYSRKVYGTGLLLGAGYGWPLARHFLVRAMLDAYFGASAANPMDRGSNISDTLVKFSLGLDYAF